MIELRWITRRVRQGEPVVLTKVLQWRQINAEINWVPGTGGGDHVVFSPAKPVSLNMERNWQPWEDVPLVALENVPEETESCQMGCACSKHDMSESPKKYEETACPACGTKPGRGCNYPKYCNDAWHLRQETALDCDTCQHNWAMGKKAFCPKHPIPQETTISFDMAMGPDQTGYKCGRCGECFYTKRRAVAHECVPVKNVPKATE